MYTTIKSLGEIMFTPRESLYINTFLEKEERGIWSRYFNKGYEVGIKRKGRYVLEFDTVQQSIQFEQRLLLSDDSNISLSNGVIIIYKKDNDHTTIIKCGQNEELAKKLTKHLRKQWVVTRRQELKQKLNQQKITHETMQQEVKDTGLKF